MLPRVHAVERIDMVEYCALDRSFWLLLHLAAAGDRLVRDGRWSGILEDLYTIQTAAQVPANVSAWLPNVDQAMRHVALPEEQLWH